MSKEIYTRDELIDQIKHCGQSIIDNANSILGDERYFSSLTVIFDVNRSKNFVPDIQVQRRFIPELEIEGFQTYKELKRERKEKNETDMMDGQLIFKNIENHIPRID